MLGYRLYFHVFPSSQRDWIFRFLNVALDRIFSFSKSIEEIENWDFGTLPCFSPFTKQLENWHFFPSFHVLLQCGDGLLGRVYVLGREANSHYVTTLWQVKCWKHYLQTEMSVKITKFSWGCTAITTQTPQLLFETNHTGPLTPPFAQNLPNMQ